MNIQTLDTHTHKLLIQPRDIQTWRQIHRDFHFALTFDFTPISCWALDSWGFGSWVPRQFRNLWGGTFLVWLGEDDGIDLYTVLDGGDDVDVGSDLDFDVDVDEDVDEDVGGDLDDVVDAAADAYFLWWWRWCGGVDDDTATIWQSDSDESK